MPTIGWKRASVTNDPVRLRTLTLIRWVAIIGQVLTLLVVHFGLGFQVPLDSALAIVGASLLLNLVVITGHPKTIHLGERAAATFLAFDILQLAALLYLTGGLDNPFSFLLLAPIAVSATILSVRSTIALCILSIICITLLAIYHYPLPWTEKGFYVPRVYVLGTWVALVIGIIFFAIYTWRVADEARRMSTALATSQLALAREQQLAAVGGLAAAAAHELGSPLSTIAVVSNEIERELPDESPIREDMRLLMGETRRCRDILAELSERSVDNIDGRSPFALLPMHALVQAAAERHKKNNILFKFVSEPKSKEVAEPVVMRSPEIVHGLGNLIQNASQFATTNVQISTFWDVEYVTIVIQDDGMGFSPGLLERLGEPYIDSRNRSDGRMGLGIFIAQTLLERSGAGIKFSNTNDGGAIVEILWRRDELEILDKHAQR
ncbi:MAG: two-component sensor histidine kinase [Rhodospirillaceae bacterium]|nr:two-component sensor histidine kinase [Rhodospirillaceae bacterium]